MGIGGTKTKLVSWLMIASIAASPAHVFADTTEDVKVGSKGAPNTDLTASMRLAAGTTFTASDLLVRIDPSSQVLLAYDKKTQANVPVTSLVLTPETRQTLEQASRRSGASTEEQRRIGRELRELYEFRDVAAEAQARKKTNGKGYISDHCESGSDPHVSDSLEGRVAGVVIPPSPPSAADGASAGANAGVQQPPVTPPQQGNAQAPQPGSTAITPPGVPPARSPASSETTAGNNSTPLKPDPTLDYRDRLFLPIIRRDVDSRDTLVKLGNTTEEASRAAIRQEFVETVINSRKAIQDAARDDNKVVSSEYTTVPIKALGDYLGRAEKNLNEAVNLLGNTTKDLSTGDVARFRSLFMNARDKAALGAGAIAEELERNNSIDATTLFSGFRKPADNNPLVRTPDMADIFGGKEAALATSNDGLVNRMVMLNGLPEEKRAAVLAKLNYVELPEFKLPTGETKKVAILHNGYIFGGGVTGTDCSAFVSSTLPVDMRKSRFTTMDFLAMWLYIRDNEIPGEFKYKRDREILVKEASRGFMGVNLYRGGRLAPGDLLVYRLPWMSSGHIFVVRNYNPITLNAEVVEASQSAGTVRERSFALSVDPLSDPVRVFRPGLFGLRIKPRATQACSYGGDGKQTTPVRLPARQQPTGTGVAE